MDEKYSWVNTHKEITKYIRTKEHSQQELIDLLKSVGIGPFNDSIGDEGHDTELDEIDPFTFFCYIYKYGPEKRLRYLQQIAEKLGIEVPTGDSGLPSANAQKVWLFPYKKDRVNNEIQRLWRFFNKALDDQITNEDFADVLTIKNIGKTKLTEALFYSRPEKYFPINGPSKPYIKDVLGVNPEFKSYEEYQLILNKIKEKTEVPFYELSHESWVWSEASKASAPSEEETFLKNIQSIPDKQLITFFSLLDELLDFLGIKDIDKRLTFSCIKENRLILIVGQRYCLDTGIKDGPWGFISETSLEEEAGLLRHYPFDGKPTAYYNKANYQLLVDNKEKLFATIRRELDRTRKSGHRNYNNTAFEKAVFDLSYRKQFMNSTAAALSKKTIDLNTILFGPPGTGKTYSSKSMAVAAIDDGFLPSERKAINIRYNELVKQGQIQFVTFHQSTAYEDFVEGIKPIMKDEEDVSDLAYQIEDGIFKRMCIEAAYEYIKILNRDESVERTLGFSQRFDKLISEYNERIEKEGTVDIPLKSGGMISVMEISSQGNFILQHQEGQRAYTVSKSRLEKLYNEIEDFDNIPNIYSYFRSIIGGSNASAYWAILNQIYQLEITEAEQKVLAINYEDKRKAFGRINWEKINPNLSVPTYFLVIDEINRGNIAAILGELITLLEEDKRGGNPEYLEVILPYSKQKFSVPPNLYILGTMNTADRSVEALDTALRRRFAFQEIQPNPGLLRGVSVEGIDLEQLLKVINGRIRKLLDKDHMIGHAYFLPIKSANAPLSMLQSVFHNKILPLLQEYFYGNFGKIQLILGRSFVDKMMDTEFNFAADAELGDDFLERTVYEVKDVSSMDQADFKEAVMKIYKSDYA